MLRLGNLLHVRFERVNDERMIRYQYSSVGFVLVAFGDHDFVDGVGAQRFADYDVVVDVLASHASLDYEAAESIRMGIGMFIYRKLVARGDRAMIVYDLQRLIEASGS